MNRDDIIQMAEVAGMTGLESSGILENFERFAALVSAHEREACAKVCDDLVGDGMMGTAEWNSGVLNCVAAIRARGQHD